MYRRYHCAGSSWTGDGGLIINFVNTSCNQPIWSVSGNVAGISVNVQVLGALSAQDAVDIVLAHPIFEGNPPNVQINVGPTAAPTVSCNQVTVQPTTNALVIGDYLPDPFLITVLQGTVTITDKTVNTTTTTTPVTITEV